MVENLTNMPSKNDAPASPPTTPRGSGTSPINPMFSPVKPRRN